MIVFYSVYFLNFVWKECFIIFNFYIEFFIGYFIYLWGGVFLDYDIVREYLMIINCIDIKDLVSSIFVVYVFKNELLVIINFLVSKIIFKFCVCVCVFSCI